MARLRRKHTFGQLFGVVCVPEGWALAPHDADSIAVIAAHGWSTGCPVLADGSSWYSASDDYAGDSCSSGMLATSGGTYTVTSCTSRVLARCG